MAKAVATPKSTGGGGFLFEDKVCAHFLACMLADEPPLDAGIGVLARIDFQTRPDGWFLDDVLLTLASGTELRRCALSVKSNQQFSGTAAPADFVANAWEQILHVDSKQFDLAADFLGLVTSRLPHNTRTTVREIMRKARVEDPVLLASRYAMPGWANENERRIFESFGCPANLGEGRDGAEVATGVLLARCVHLEFDFEEVPSESERNAVGLCRRSLICEDIQEASQLWDRLLRITSEFRPSAGSIAPEKLLALLRGAHRIKGRPNHRRDWNKLAECTSTAMSEAQNMIGGRIHLPRPSETTNLDQAVQSSKFIALLGSSGIGKSAIARQWAESRIASGDKVLWFDGRSFDRIDTVAFEHDLKLDHSLQELVLQVPNPRAFLLIDGLDRHYEPALFRNLAGILRTMKFGRDDSAWQLVITCQTQEWPRIQTTLGQLGVPPNAWQVIHATPIKIEDLGPVWEAFPRAARLRLQLHLHPLLTKLKILDLIALRSTVDEIDTEAWIGESSVANWFWQSEISEIGDGARRARFVRLLAERQADQMRAAVPLDAFDVSELEPLEALKSDRVCRQTDDERVAFNHDLYGDWARLRLLIDHADDLPSYLKDRLNSPLWHRAVRLYGLRLLELRGDVEAWRASFQMFVGDDNSLARDLLLESVIFAIDPFPYLQRLAGDLFADNGRLLKRLLGRFLHFATVPDPRMQALAKSEDFDEAWVAAHHRIPNWPYWPPMLRFIYEHRQVVVSIAPLDVARIAEMWLSAAPQNWPFRREAAELGLLLGEVAMSERTDHSRRDRKPYYRAALAAAQDLPDTLADFARRASERIPRPKEIASSGPPPLPKFIRYDPRFDPNQPEPEPWPDGPYEDVDNQWREVVLEAAALRPLITVRPDLAKEVVLAVLIRSRHRYEWADHWSEERQLGIHDVHGWQPPLYIHGPFLMFLQVNFDEGLDLIVRLTNFAAERWAERKQKEVRRRFEETAEPAEQDALRRHIQKAERPPESLRLRVGGSDRVLLGDERVYGWSVWLTCPPLAVTVALMALEQFLYQRIEAGEPVVDLIARILDRAQCSAFIKVLCDVGRRQPGLFEGPLMPILASPEIYKWDIECRVHGNSHLGIGAPLKGFLFLQLAREFHGHEHRKKDLRDVVLEMFFNRAEVRSYLEKAREEWETRIAEQPEGEFSRFLEGLAVRFNPDNYEIQEDPERGPVLVNVRGQELQARRADELRAIEDDRLVSLFAGHCRMLVDEEKPVEDLDSFLTQVDRVYALAQENNDRYAPQDIVGALCGAACVLIRFHRDWLESHLDRAAWCVEQLRSAILQPPKPRDFDVAEDAATWTWDCFAAEAIPILWAEDLNDPEVPRLVAHLIFVRHYAAVEILFRRCAERRHILEANFIRLRRLLFEWSFVRERIMAVHRRAQYAPVDDEVLQRFESAVNGWAVRQIDAFAEGHTSAAIEPWKEMDCPDLFREIDTVLAARRRRPVGLDFHLIRRAHVWIPTPDGARNDGERADWIAFWREALSYVTEEGASTEENYPDEDARWVLDGFAATIAHLAPPETPEHLWLPILRLPEKDYHWLDVFLRAFHRNALQGGEVPAGYEFAFRGIFEQIVAPDGEEQTAASFYYYRDVWPAVVGVDGFTQSYWDDRHRGLVSRLADVFERWAKESLGDGRLIGRFARFLERAAAEPILLRGICWIEEGLLRAGDDVANEGRAEEPLASLLTATWCQHEQRVRSDAAAFRAFRNLLRYLVDRQNALALELQARIATLGAT